MKNILLFALSLATAGAYAQSGITWSSANDVTSNSYGNMHPRIVLDAAGNPLVLFGSMDGDAQFTRWNGTAFTMPMPVNPSNMPAMTASWAGPDIASKGDTVYVVFKDTPEDINHHIFIVRSFDGGVTFSAPYQVEYNTDSMSRFPTVAVDANGHPIVAYMKFNSDYSNAHWVVTRSTDYGVTFSPDVPASGAGGELVCDCCPGAIVTDGNNVAVLYRANLSNLRDTWTSLSTDGGASFGGSFNVDQHDWMLMSCPSTGPDAVIVDDTLYSVFMNGASGDNMVYENQTSFASPTGTVAPAVTGTFAGLTQQNYPRIDQYNGATAKVWKQVVSGNTQLALLFTDDIHQGFPANYDTVATGSVTNADVAVHNGAVHVVWEDASSGTVKYRKGTFLTTTLVSTPADDTTFGVQPNPAINSFVVSSQTDGALINVTDVTGRNVVTRNAVGRRTTIDTSDWDAGVYVVTATANGRTSTMKVILNGR